MLLTTNSKRNQKKRESLVSCFSEKHAETFAMLVLATGALKEHLHNGIC